MKQAYYLAPGERETRFDGLFSELDIVPTALDISRVKSLVAFVSKEKTLHQMDYIIFDLEGCAYSQEHILSAVQLLRRFSVAELVFLAPAGDETDLLFGRLAAFRVDRLIPVFSSTDPVKELRAALNGEGDPFQRRSAALGRSLSTQAARKAAPFRIPPGLTITIAVAGAQSRVGTTTQCFALFHYLNALGFRPALLDSGGGMSAFLAGLYDQETEPAEQGLTIRGVPFCQKRSETYNAYLLDLGTLRAETAALFSAQDVSLLVGGVKPWELPCLADAIRLLNSTPKRLAVLLSFAESRDAEELGGRLEVPVVHTPYHPDLWSPGSTAACQAALLPYLKELCGGDA